MPKATVTVRELKNKDTGVDLSVTSYRELPGLMRSSYEYQILVVSNLSCFKLPSHKDSDVVQFTIFKKFPEFEDLRAKLNEAFSGTALPPIVKKSIIVNDAIIKERRSNLDSFLKFLSSTPRITVSSHVLTFLGVEAGKAKRFTSEEADGPAGKDGDGKENSDGESPGEKQTRSLFDEEDEGEEDGGGDFLTGDDAFTAAENDEDDFFSASDAGQSAASNARLFESQDLKRELTEDDEKDFSFVQDAIITKRQVVSVAAEDNDDLLNIDEDIDLETILTLNSDGNKPPRQQQQQHQPQPPPSEPRDPTPQSPPAKPSAAPKPSIPSKPKPTLPSKPSPSPKPRLPSKPGAATPSGEKQKPSPPPRPGGGSGAAKPEQPKPIPAQRPKPAPRKPKPGTGDAEKTGGGDEGGRRGAGEKDDLSSDDIMQYITANDAEGDADLDLFS